MRLGLDGPLADVGVAGASVAWIEPRGSSRPGTDSTDALDCGGATLLRGLWDRHVHARQCALRRAGVDLGGCTTAAAAADLLTAAARTAHDSPVMAFGAPGHVVRELDATGALIDEHRAVLVQSADLHTCWLNAAAARGIDVTERAGVLHEQQAFAAAAQLSDLVDVEIPLRAVLADAAARGVVGILDFEMADNVAQWSRRAAQTTLPVRVECSIPRSRLDSAVAAGLRTGAPLDPAGQLRVGPVKVFADGALGSATAWCSAPYPGRLHDHGRQEIDTAELAQLIAYAGRHGIGAAVHAIGDRANASALAAFAAAGCGGRIEHAQLVASHDLPRFAQLGVAAGVQPAHLLDDRDLADELWAGQTALGYAYGSLHRAGAQLEFGSDAPVSPLDPWRGIVAAVARTADERPPWHNDQRLTLRSALDASAAGRSTPQTGDVADLIVVDWADGSAHETSASRKLDAPRVVGTMLGGEWTHRP